VAAHAGGALGRTFFCTRAALKIMNPQLSGSIINMGSIVGTAGVAGAATYAAAKSGILGFTRAVACEVVSRGIRVNAIAPGWIDTTMTSFLGDVRPLIAAQTPMGRRGAG
jgi:3-oxoacyl-[acyl-carrier protein] reductase